MASERIGLPFLAPGQAGKEITHNEALALIDLAIAPVVEAVLADPPASPGVGRCWIVGESAGGDWTGREGQLAGWTAGGWRFVDLPIGAGATVGAARLPATREASGWAIGTARAARIEIGGEQVIGARGGAVPDPAGGATVDGEARAALVALLERLRAHGLIARHP